MENLGMTLFGGAYRNKKILITGHTGFKGSWLSLWLKNLGADVYGIALAPDTQPNHWDLIAHPVSDHHCDIRDYRSLAQIVANVQPDLVFHLAAQPLVLQSYRDPIETWSTNVMGTVNVLEACRTQAENASVVVVTTDKCYENKDWVWSYRENDRLGGHDPYSASKAASEIVVDSYRKSFFDKNSNALIASARAGNVIGGGDWSKDRLIPDLVRSVEKGVPLQIRSPTAVRPWQHVLDCLSGYLLLGQKLLNKESEFASAWNFGPDSSAQIRVSDVLSQFQTHWPRCKWVTTNETFAHEAKTLQLDISKATHFLKWQPIWSIAETIQYTAQWYLEYLDNNRVTSEMQLTHYIDDAKRLKAVWTQQ